ncbi:hypothetical protein KR018_004316, partial [Drosophila ironensis]
MRLDVQVMIMCWLICFLLVALAPSATSGQYQVRKKRLPTFEAALVEGPKCEKEKPKPCVAKQRASGIAMQAAKEAKKANDDMANAVKVAADRIKTVYADKAMAAAKAAEAVLAGKRQALEQLDAEVHEAEQVVHDESQELSTAEVNTMLATKACEQSQQELKMVLMALKLAKENVDTSEQVFNVWAQSVSDKTALLEAAQRRVSLLMRQLSEARCDHDKTLKAANNAARAAQDAKHRIQQTDGE